MKKAFWSYFKHYGRFLGKNLTNESARRWEKNSSYKTIKNIRLASMHAVSSTSLANRIETTWAEIGKMIVLVLNDLLYIKKFSSGYSCFFVFLKKQLENAFFSHSFRARRPQLKGIHWTNLPLLIPTSSISWFVISLYMQLRMRF